MSRWMMPLACAAASAAAACWLKEITSSGPSPCRPLCQILLQRLAAQQLHHQVGPAILLPGVIDRAHIGMVQRGRRTRLAQEALMRQMAAGVGRGCPGVRRGRAAADRCSEQIALGNQLQRDLALQPRVQARDTPRPCRPRRSSRAGGTDQTVFPLRSSSSLAAQTGFERLSAVPAVYQRRRLHVLPHSDGDDILTVLCDTTGLKFGRVARRWVHAGRIPLVVAIS